MRDDFRIEQIEPVKVALTAAQVRELNLPSIMKAKATSSRHDGFVEQHGDDVFELEAVPPDRLRESLRQAIDSLLDVDAFNAEIDREKRDAADLERIRRKFQHAAAEFDLQD
jgi:hypothetical protein